MDEQIASYSPLIERWARRYDGVRGAEFDDLYQEGQITVWLALTHGFAPDADDVKQACRNWVRHISREGMGGFDESLPEEA